MDERFAKAPIGIVETGPNGDVTAINDRAVTLLDCEELVDEDISVQSIVPDSVDRIVPRAFETPPASEGTGEEYFPALDRWLAIEIVRSTDRVFVYLQDVSENVRRERRTESLEGELRRAVSINQLVEQIIEDVLTASNRAEIAETICTHLGRTESYEFAWVGERDPQTDRFVMRSATGTSTRTLERIEEQLDSDRSVPEFQAMETAQAEIVQPLGESEVVPEAIRRAAFADGLQSLLAVPITDGTNLFGVVGIYTADRNAFSERERSSFETVGKLAGFAVNATRHRSILLSDTVVELSVRLTDGAAPLVAATSETNGVLSIRGVVACDSAYRCFLDIDGSDVTVVQSTLEDSPDVLSTRIMSRNDGGGSLEISLAETTPLGQWLSRGASIRSANFEGGAGELVMTVPKEEDIRRLAEGFTRRYDAELIGKRERERDSRSVRELRDRIRDDLTEKQREALRTALFADYFESPHGSSAEEIAESLGITGPTLLHHLRAGQRKLLEAVFDDESRVQGPPEE
jgi:predicted DNA binding protein